MKPAPTTRTRIPALASACALCLGWCGPALADGSITLLPIARLSQSSTVRLRDIAELRGAECERLGEIEVDARSTRDGRVTVHEVRDLIDAHGVGNWGRIALSGADCRLVRIESPETPTPTEPASDAPASETPSDSPLKGLIVETVAASMGIDPSRLRLTFDDRDQTRELLHTDPRGRRVEIRPIGRSDTLPISITMYDGPSIAARGVLRARVEVQREIAVARVDIARGALVTEDLIERRTVWLAPGDRSLDPSSLGERSIAQSRIAQGRTLTEQSVQAAFAIEKGDIAVIHCLSGGFVMKMRARALADGRPGDSIEFAPLDGRKGRVVLARVDGPGTAIARADEPGSEEASR